MDNTVQKQYLSEVKKFLNCSSRDKRKILKDLKRSTDNYMAEYPNATKEELEEIFGTPEKIARSYYASLETENLRKRFRVRRIVGIGCAVFFAVIIILEVIILKSTAQSRPGYFIETIEEIEIIEDEEMQNKEK